MEHTGRIWRFLFQALVVSILDLPNGAVASHGRSILVLGGNGFLGSETVSQLLDEGYKVTILSRGNEYFDSSRRILPHVHRHLKCDRKTLLSKTCPDVFDGVDYDLVIDFSSYRDQEIEQIISALHKRVGLYVFISTDAIYDVREKSHEAETREEDANEEIRNIKHRRHREERHVYGYNKWQAEERLREQRKRFGFPYVILRLADAVGERDTTLRWSTYQLWIKLHKRLNLPVPLPEAISKKKFSLVYSRDVASAILKIAKDPRNFEDTTLNLAFAEHVHLRGLLQLIGECLGITDIKYNDDEETAWFRYPSTDSGPISIEEAKQSLNWEPTEFRVAVNNTCNFFEEAMIDRAFAKDRELMLASFIEDAIPANFQDERLLLDALRESYGPKVFENIDLGFDVDPSELRIEAKPDL